MYGTNSKLATSISGTADNVDNITLDDVKKYYQAVAVNHNLGGSFSGQFFQILRLQKGYTYGAYSSISRENAGGLFTAFQVSVQM
jgi:predicted Zn-dependent peptidase